jgi:hypothetical protein
VIYADEYLAQIDTALKLCADLLDDSKRKLLIRAEPLKISTLSPKQRKHVVSRIESPKSPASKGPGLKLVLQDVKGIEFN